MREATPRLLNLLGFVCTISCVLIAAACGSGSSTDTVVGPSQTRCTVQTQADTTSFPATGGTGVVRITVDRECTWSVQSEAPWVTLQAERSGQGDASVRFTVASNGDPPSRTTRVTVNNHGLQISQDGQACTFRVSSSRETAAASGEQKTVHVESSSPQCQWSATSEVPWITIIGGQTRSGSGDLRFEVAAVTGPPRFGMLSIAGQRVEVEQGTGCTYTAGTTALSVGAEGGTSEVPVSAPPGCAWRAESQTPWLTIVKGESGSGSGSASVRAEPTAGPPRTGTIVVAGRTVTVTQSSGCAVTVQPAAHATPVGGGAGSVAVSAAAGCGWTATTNAPWIAITAGASGNGAGQVQFTAAANTGPARSASLTVGNQIVAVSQPSGCTFSVAAGPELVSPAAQSVALSVSTAAGCRWNAASQAPWITVPVTSGLGPAQVAFALAANNGPERSGVVVIQGKSVTLTQTSPCAWAVAPPLHEMGPDGGRGNVLLILNGPCSWTASSPTSWITMEAGTSGTGNGLVQFIVAPNYGPARSGIVKIAGFDYVVTQPAR